MNKFKSGDKVEVKNSSEPAINGFVGKVIASAGLNHCGVRNYRVEAIRDFTGGAPFLYKTGDWMYVSEDSLCLIETPQDAPDPDDTGYVEQMRQDLDATIAEAWQRMNDTQGAAQDAQKAADKAREVADATETVWRTLRDLREQYNALDKAINKE